MIAVIDACWPVRLRRERHDDAMYEVVEVTGGVRVPAQRVFAAAGFRRLVAPPDVVDPQDYFTVTSTECQPVAPSGTGSAFLPVCTPSVASVARTVSRCFPGLASQT